MLFATKTTKLHENKNDGVGYFVGRVAIIINRYSDTNIVAGI